jgi:L-lactate dehydrogenase (cytochrome)
MKEIINIDDARRLARRRLPRIVFDFVDGGAEDENTVRSNQRAFDNVTFRPRVLVDVSNRDLTTTVLGERISLPVMLAPTGFVRFVSREAELAAVRSTAKAGTVFAVSTLSSFSIEEIAAVATGPLWFQLYLPNDKDVGTALVHRAYEAGYRALCLTVDTPCAGKRERDIRNGLTDPPRVKVRTILDASWRFAWLRDFLLGEKALFRNLTGLVEAKSTAELGSFVKEKMLNPAVSWNDLAWLRKEWDRPLVVKGILSAEDALRALDHGVDGILVSNHGGRQLESAPSTLEVLPEIVEAVDGRAEVFLDGGVRRGRDVVKAKALGARACLIGRPFLWGLALGGEEGVARVLEVYRDEIDRTLAMIGRSKFSEVDSSAVRVRAA